MSRNKLAEGTDDGDKKDEVRRQLDDKAVLDAASEVAIAQPPEMPIVIDELAVRDILGVSIDYEGYWFKSC